MRSHDDDNELTLQVEGIVCTGCATDMETVLKAVDGIESAGVDYGTGTVSIQYDPDEITREEVCFQVEKLGFKIITTR